MKNIKKFPSEKEQNIKIEELGKKHKVLFSEYYKDYQGIVLVSFDFVDWLYKEYKIETSKRDMCEIVYDWVIEVLKSK